MRDPGTAYRRPGLTTLTRLRLYYGWTLQEMSSRTSVPVPTLNRIEKGQLPGLVHGMAIARLFRVSVEDLWGHLVEHISP